MSRQTKVLWESGTAYELFISLMVLHEPDKYGLRAAWAAGVRSRIPTAERKFLEEFLPFLDLPIGFIRSLPGPRDAISVLWALRQVPAAERFLRLAGLEDCDTPLCRLTRSVMAAKAWTLADLDAMVAEFEKMKMTAAPYDRAGLTGYLGWLARPAELGEMLLSALQAYFEAFFKEEEKRIAPVLQNALERAQNLALTLSPSELLAELSQGVHYDEIVSTPEVVFLPAFWNTPLVIFIKLGEHSRMIIFGARPPDMAAIPGEAVPDGLVRTLKALADPTRLKILHYLSKEELTPSELARRLHLRAPTVTHHLNELRLAGLVNLTVRPQERVYSARREALPGTFGVLSGFLDQSAEKLSAALDENMEDLEDTLDGKK